MVFWISLICSVNYYVFSKFPKYLLTVLRFFLGPEKSPERPQAFNSSPKLGRAMNKGSKKKANIWRNGDLPILAILNLEYPANKKLEHPSKNENSGIWEIEDGTNHLWKSSFGGHFYHCCVSQDWPPTNVPWFSTGSFVVCLSKSIGLLCDGPKNLCFQVEISV